MMILMLVKIMI